MGGPVMGGRGSRGRALPQVGGEHGTTPPPAPAEPDKQAPPATDRIRDAFTAIVADNPDQWVSLVDLRAQLGDMPRAEQDAALRQLLDDDLVRLEEQPFAWRIGPAERDAAIHVGGQDLHLFRIYPPDYR